MQEQQVEGRNEARRLDMLCLQPVDNLKAEEFARGDCKGAGGGCRVQTIETKKNA